MKDTKKNSFIFNLILNPGIDQKKEEAMIQWASEHLSEGVRITEMYKANVPYEVWEEVFMTDAVSPNKDEDSIHLTKEKIVVLPIYAKHQEDFTIGVSHMAKFLESFLLLFGENSGHFPVNYYSALFEDIILTKVKTTKNRIEIAA